MVNEDRKAKLDRLAQIYVDARSLHEYKCKADLQNIDRKNYLGLFDPFVLYWMLENYGQLTRYAVGIGFMALGTLLMVPFIGLTSNASAVGGVIGIVSLALFDYGVKIAIKQLKLL